MPRLGEADLERVRGIPLFDGLEPEWLRSLIGDAWAIAFEAPTLLFSQGDPADGFFVVLAGRVVVVVLTGTAPGRKYSLPSAPLSRAPPLTGVEL